MSDLPPERVCACFYGDSGTGKSRLVADLTHALHIDTNLLGGLAAYDERIRRNHSERVALGSYPDIMEDLETRKADGRLATINTLVIDDITTPHQEAVLRYNPTFANDPWASREYDKADKEWRRLTTFAHYGDFHLIVTALPKKRYEVNGKQREAKGLIPDGPRKLEAYMNQVIYASRAPGNRYPSVATVEKWRRDEEDRRGPAPRTFPFTLESFLKIHGSAMDGARRAVELASAEQVAEIARLLAILRTPDEWVQRCFAKARVEAWEEMPAAEIGKCVLHLESVLRTRQSAVVRERNGGNP